MTRDAAERARECLVFNDPCHNDVNIPTTVKNISALLTQVQAEARVRALEEAAQYFLSDAYIDNEHGGNSPLDLATLVRDLKQRAALAQALQLEEKEGES